MIDSILSSEIDWDLRWRSANIPIQLRGQTLNDWPPNSASGVAALQAAQTFVSTLPQRLLAPNADSNRQDRALIGVGMSILGPNGTGKTDLSCAILTEAHYAHGVSISYATAAGFISACTICANEPRDEDERSDPAGKYQRAVRLRRRMALSSLVVLDDLGKEHKTPTNFAARKINNFLRYRHEYARPTVVNSNDPIEKWAIYDAALPSFAAQALPPTLLIGADLRARR